MNVLIGLYIFFAFVVGVCFFYEQESKYSDDEFWWEIFFTAILAGIFWPITLLGDRQ